MPRKKQSLLAIPENAKKDAKTLMSIVDRWGTEAEGFLKDVFAWGKKHKFLVITMGLLFLAVRWAFSTGGEEKEGW